MHRLIGPMLGCMLATLATEASADATAGVVILPVTSADRNSAGQPIVFPRKNGHVTAAVYEIAPGVTLPVHKHPFPRLGYVLSGTLRVKNLEAGTTATYRSGDFLLEAVDQWHEGQNAGPEPLKLLVIDLLEKDAAATVKR